MIQDAPVQTTRHSLNEDHTIHLPYNDACIRLSQQDTCSGFTPRQLTQFKMDNAGQCHVINLTAPLNSNTWRPNDLVFSARKAELLDTTITPEPKYNAIPTTLQYEQLANQMCFLQIQDGGRCQRFKGLGILTRGVASLPPRAQGQSSVCPMKLLMNSFSCPRRHLMDRGARRAMQLTALPGSHYQTPIGTLRSQGGAPLQDADADCVATNQ